MKNDNLEGILEGLLFVRGDEGLTLLDISSVLDISVDEAKGILMNLQKTYEDDKRGLRIRFLGETFKLSTKEEHKEYFRKFFATPQSNSLSESSLEVLAIIAYNAPITRAEIEQMRGIESTYTIRKLLGMGLIKEAGKSSMPGHPNLYKTTKEFLDYFGLATIEDLPKLKENKKDETEEELFTSIYKEEK